MSEKQSILRADRVSRIYADGEVRALVDVTVEIGRGQYVAVMGPSGSGKSTLLNLLGALDVPSSGTICFDGRPLSTLQSLDRFRALELGFVFQSFHLLPTLTAAENVQIPMFEGPRLPAARAKKAAELLEIVGMTPRAGHLPNRLSVGERQRVAIARALANDPQVLLADEPTGNLDSQTAGQVLELFDQLHRRQQMTIVVVTHGQEVAERAERIVQLRDGRVVAEKINRSATPSPGAGESPGPGTESE